MRIVVAAVGRLKQGPERELAERFRRNFAAYADQVSIAGAGPVV